MLAIGVLLHAIGGFAAGSFYIPFKEIGNWAMESAGGQLAWAITTLQAGAFTWPLSLCSAFTEA